MALFIANIEKYKRLKGNETGSLTLGITAATFNEAELILHKHLFKNELTQIESNSLEILEEISSYSDQFADLSDAMKTSNGEGIDPENFGLFKIKPHQVSEYAKAKIIVHTKRNIQRSIIINGQPMRVSDLQQIGKFRKKRLENTITYIN